MSEREELLEKLKKYIVNVQDDIDMATVAFEEDGKIVWGLVGLPKKEKEEKSL